MTNLQLMQTSIEAIAIGVCVYLVFNESKMAKFEKRLFEKVLRKRKIKRIK